jgi:hypothetical protein
VFASYAVLKVVGVFVRFRAPPLNDGNIDGVVLALSDNSSLFELGLFLTSSLVSNWAASYCQSLSTPGPNI